MSPIQVTDYPQANTLPTTVGPLEDMIRAISATRDVCHITQDAITFLSRSLVSLIESVKAADTQARDAILAVSSLQHDFDEHETDIKLAIRKIQEDLAQIAKDQQGLTSQHNEIAERQRRGVAQLTDAAVARSIKAVAGLTDHVDSYTDQASKRADRIERRLDSIERWILDQASRRTWYQRLFTRRAR